MVGDSSADAGDKVNTERDEGNDTQPDEGDDWHETAEEERGFNRGFLFHEEVEQFRFRSARRVEVEVRSE